MRLDIALLTIAPTLASPPSTVQPVRPSILATDEAVAESPASELKGEVIALDAETNTLTLKAKAANGSLAEWELTVEGEAVAALPALMPGDRVTVACREGTSADKCVVTAITKREPKQAQ